MLQTSLEEDMAAGLQQLDLFGMSTFNEHNSFPNNFHVIAGKKCLTILKLKKHAW